jgi:hypothetical protein
MKTILAILIVVTAVLATGCTTTTTGPVLVETSAPAADLATAPDLVGTWAGTSVGHVNAKGWVDAGSPSFEITDQRDLAFTGIKTYATLDGTKKTENISGVITRKGEIYIAELESGIVMGDLVGPDTMELVYVEDGTNAKAFLYTLNRQ